MKRFILSVLAVIVLFGAVVEAKAYTYFGDVYGPSALAGVRVLAYWKQADGSWGYWGEAQTYASAEYQFNFPAGEYILQYAKEGYKSQLYNGGWGAFDIASAMILRSPGGNGQEMLANVYLQPISEVATLRWEAAEMTEEGQTGDFVVSVERPTQTTVGDGFLVWVTLEGQAADNLQMTGVMLVGRKGMVVPLGESREIRIPFVIAAKAPQTTMNVWAHVASVPMWAAKVTNMSAGQKTKFFKNNPGKTPAEYARIIRDALWNVQTKAQLYWIWSSL